MPVYQYEDKEGRVVELVRPIAERDSAPRGFKRISVPGRVAVFGTSSDPLEESCADAAVPRALKALDNQTVHKMVKESGFSVNKFKEVWGL